jgi:hypothetical protein
MPKRQFPRSYSDSSDVTYIQERIIIRQSCFQVIAYRLMNGEIAVPTRNMTAVVHKPKSKGKRFIESLGVETTQVVLPNHVVTDMISISCVFDFCKYLNESGQGNFWTEIGQHHLKPYAGVEE